MPDTDISWAGGLERAEFALGFALVWEATGCRKEGEAGDSEAASIRKRLEP